LTIRIGPYIHSSREGMLLGLAEQALRSFEMFVTICQSTWRYVIED